MEHVIYRDPLGNLISPSRAVIAGTTYPVQGISSVRMSVTNRPTWAIAIIAFFAVGLAVSHVWAGVVVLAALAWLVWAKTKPEWLVIIATSGQERAALKSHRKEEIEAIVTALNEAIITR